MKNTKKQGLNQKNTDIKEYCNTKSKIMADFPSLNFRNVPFFFMSLFGVLFILSLMGLIKGKNEGALAVVFFLNVFISVSGWICQQIAYFYYAKEDYPKLASYLTWELIISGVVTISVFFTTLLGLIMQV
jgi:hypothetical protein